MPVDNETDRRRLRCIWRRMLLERLKPGSPRWHQVLQKIQQAEADEKKGLT